MAMIKKGIVLMNLGSPDSTEVKDVRRYLDEFLMDKRVIDTPLLWRALLVKGIIVPFRAPKSAEAYKSIWTKEGSPLIVISEQQQQALQEQVEEPVVIAMRYGNPTPWDAFDELMQKVPGLEEVVLVPMYPHYAMSSYETAVEYAKKVHKEKKYPFKLSVVPPFYKDSRYIDALSESIAPYLENEYDHIVFSYHGIPERHVQKTDPSGQHCLKNIECCNVDNPAHAFCYRHQILKTTQLVAEKLNIPKERYSYSFQSRLGRDEWLKPYTAVRLGEMPNEGIKKLLVVCPAFVADCLETLEEMAEEGKEIFLHAGGEQFTLIPCMNVHPAWIGALKELVEDAK
ncbi:MAG: ferrochelatase [Chitinophagaceae bacterium]|nr:ferrochelatase [Chitinophagaceae bacterium]